MSDQYHRFLDITLDPVFKKALGRRGCEPRLVSLINALLRLKGKKTIVSVDIIPQEEVPDTPEKKKSIVDVRCTDQRGFRYIVEIQKDYDQSFKKRVQFYGAKTYSNQLKKGEDHLDLKPVIVLAFLDYKLFPKKKNFISYHRMLDTETGENDFEDISYVIAELPKFRKHPEYSSSELEKWWLDAIANSLKKQDIPENAPPEIKDFYHDIDGASWTPEERAMLDKFLDEKRVYQANMRVEREEGKAEGREEGKTTEKLEIARKMKKRGYPIADIAEDTGLSKSDIEKL